MKRSLEPDFGEEPNAAHGSRPRLPPKKEEEEEEEATVAMTDASSTDESVFIEPSVEEEQEMSRAEQDAKLEEDIRAHRQQQNHKTNMTPEEYRAYCVAADEHTAALEAHVRENGQYLFAIRADGADLPGPLERPRQLNLDDPELKGLLAYEFPATSPVSSLPVPYKERRCMRTGCTTGRPSEPERFHCPDCYLVDYCSQDCMTRDAAAHRGSIRCLARSDADKERTRRSWTLLPDLRKALAEFQREQRTENDLLKLLLPDSAHGDLDALLVTDKHAERIVALVDAHRQVEAKMVSLTMLGTAANVSASELVRMDQFASMQLHFAMLRKWRDAIYEELLLLVDPELVTFETSTRACMTRADEMRGTFFSTLMESVTTILLPAVKKHFPNGRWDEYYASPVFLGRLRDAVAHDPRIDHYAADFDRMVGDFHGRSPDEHLEAYRRLADIVLQNNAELGDHLIRNLVDQYMEKRARDQEAESAWEILRFGEGFRAHAQTAVDAVIASGGGSGKRRLDNIFTDALGAVKGFVAWSRGHAASFFGAVRDAVRSGSTIPDDAYPDDVPPNGYLAEYDAAFFPDADTWSPSGKRFGWFIGGIVVRGALDAFMIYETVMGVNAMGNLVGQPDAAGATFRAEISKVRQGVNGAGDTRPHVWHVFPSLDPKLYGTIGTGALNVAAGLVGGPNMHDAATEFALAQPLGNALLYPRTNLTPANWGLNSMVTARAICVDVGRNFLPNLMIDVLKERDVRKKFTAIDRHNHAVTAVHREKTFIDQQVAAERTKRTHEINTDPEFAVPGWADLEFEKLRKDMNALVLALVGKTYAAAVNSYRAEALGRQSTTHYTSHFFRALTGTQLSHVVDVIGDDAVKRVQQAMDRFKRLTNGDRLQQMLTLIPLRPPAEVERNAAAFSFGGRVLRGLVIVGCLVMWPWASAAALTLGCVGSMLCGARNILNPFEWRGIFKSYVDTVVPVATGPELAWQALAILTGNYFVSATTGVVLGNLVREYQGIDPRMNAYAFFMQHILAPALSGIAWKNLPSAVWGYMINPFFTFVFVAATNLARLTGGALNSAANVVIAALAYNLVHTTDETHLLPLADVDEAFRKAQAAREDKADKKKKKKKKKNKQDSDGDSSGSSDDDDDDGNGRRKKKKKKGNKGGTGAGAVPQPAANAPQPPAQPAANAPQPPAQPAPNAPQLPPQPAPNNVQQPPPAPQQPQTSFAPSNRLGPQPDSDDFDSMARRRQDDPLSLGPEHVTAPRQSSPKSAPAAAAPTALADAAMAIRTWTVKATTTLVRAVDAMHMADPVKFPMRGTDAQRVLFNLQLAVTRQVSDLFDGDVTATSSNNNNSSAGAAFRDYATMMRSAPFVPPSETQPRPPAPKNEEEAAAMAADAFMGMLAERLPLLEERFRDTVRLVSGQGVSPVLFQEGEGAATDEEEEEEDISPLFASRHLEGRRKHQQDERNRKAKATKQPWQIRPDEAAKALPDIRFRMASGLKTFMDNVTPFQMAILMTSLGVLVQAQDIPESEKTGEASPEEAAKRTATAKDGCDLVFNGTRAQFDKDMSVEKAKEIMEHCIVGDSTTSCDAFVRTAPLFKSYMLAPESNVEEALEVTLASGRVVQDEIVNNLFCAPMAVDATVRQQMCAYALDTTKANATPEWIRNMTHAAVDKLEAFPSFIETTMPATTFAAAHARDLVTLVRRGLYAATSVLGTRPIPTVNDVKAALTRLKSNPEHLELVHTTLQAYMRVAVGSRDCFRVVHAREQRAFVQQTAEQKQVNDMIDEECKRLGLAEHFGPVLDRLKQVSSDFFRRIMDRIMGAGEVERATTSIKWVVAGRVTRTVGLSAALFGVSALVFGAFTLSTCGSFVATWEKVGKYVADRGIYMMIDALVRELAELGTIAAVHFKGMGVPPHAWESTDAFIAFIRDRPSGNDAKWEACFANAAKQLKLLRRTVPLFTKNRWETFTSFATGSITSTVVAKWYMRAALFLVPLYVSLFHTNQKDLNPYNLNHTNWKRLLELAPILALTYTSTDDYEWLIGMVLDFAQNTIDTTFHKVLGLHRHVAVVTPANKKEGAQHAYQPTGFLRTLVGMSFAIGTLALTENKANLMNPTHYYYQMVPTIFGSNVISSLALSIGLSWAGGKMEKWRKKK